MKRNITLAAVTLLAGLVLSINAAASDQNNTVWQLINEDAKSNMLYVGPVEKSGENIRRVWVKYETPADNSPSPMLFLNELDCSKKLIKRLEVKLFRDTGAGDKMLFKDISFEGQWDRPAAGIEQLLYESVCRDVDNERL